MVDAQSGVARVGVTEIVPECVDALAGMKRSQGVSPTLRGKPAKSVSNLDAKQRVVDPSLRLIDVEFGWHYVVIADEHDRRASGEKLGGMRDQALKPAQLEAEFLTIHRIAVRHVEAADQEAVDGGLNVAAVEIVVVARERAPGLDQGFAAREDRDSVPAFLTLPDRFVARRAQRALGKRL